MKISSCSDSYLNGFNEIANCRQNGFCITIVAALKILSYFTLVIPAIAYLIGRCSKSFPSPTSKKTEVVAQTQLNTTESSAPVQEAQVDAVPQIPNIITPASVPPQPADTQTSQQKQTEKDNVVPAQAYTPAGKAGRTVTQEIFFTPQSQSIKAHEITPQKKLTDKESSQLFDDFYKYTYDQSNKDELYIEVWSTDFKGPRFIRFEFFTTDWYSYSLDPFIRGKDMDWRKGKDFVLGGRDFYKILIEDIKIPNIQSIKLLPRIGWIIDDDDQNILKKKGIEFDENGFIYIPYEQFTYKTTLFGNASYRIHIEENLTKDIIDIDVTPNGCTLWQTSSS